MYSRIIYYEMKELYQLHFAFLKNILWSVRIRRGRLPTVNIITTMRIQPWTALTETETAYIIVLNSFYLRTFL